MWLRRQLRPSAAQRFIPFLCSLWLSFHRKDIIFSIFIPLSAFIYVPSQPRTGMYCRLGGVLAINAKRIKKNV